MEEGENKSLIEEITCDQTKRRKLRAVESTKGLKKGIKVKEMGEGVRTRNRVSQNIRALKAGSSKIQKKERMGKSHDTLGKRGGKVEGN